MPTKKPVANIRAINVELPHEDMMRLVRASKAAGYPDARPFASQLLLDGIKGAK